MDDLPASRLGEARDNLSNSRSRVMQAKHFVKLNHLAIALAGLAIATAATAGTPSLSAQTTFASGNNPYAVVMADLNGDGKPDMVTTNDPDGTVSVFENQTANGAASPSFAAQQTIAVGSYPESVTIADVNGDGLPDIITANSGDGTITVLLNTTASSGSAPTFAAPQVFTVGNQPEAVVAVDLNGDGIPDLAVANYADCTITVLFNNTAAGTSNLDFSNQQTFQLTGNPMQLAVADLNGDTLPDLVATQYGGGDVAVLLNGTTTGSMTPVFADAQYVSVGGTYSLAVADLNGDSVPDIAVVDVVNQQMAVLVNTTVAGSSTVSFDAPQTFALGTDPQCIMAVDLDLDGKPDLVVANYMDGTIGVLHNTTTAGSSTISFDPMQAFSAGSQAEGVAAADINGDGKPDVVVTDNGAAMVGVFLNTTP